MTSIIINPTKKRKDEEVPSSRKIQAFIISGGTPNWENDCAKLLIKKLPNDSKVLVILHQHAKSFGLETTVVSVEKHVELVSIEQVFDFGSGCICCSPDGDLTRLLCDIASSNSSNKPTHIFIETTGVADVRSFAPCFVLKRLYRHSFI